MTHLTADELVDIVEGTRPESAAQHLAACAECRASLAELRSTMSAIADVDVPEPSPLFWDHLSRRVHDAIEADGLVHVVAPAPRAGLGGWLAALVGRRAFQAALVACASLAIVVLVTSRTHAPSPAPGVETAIVVPAGVDLFSDSPIENDTPLALVATLASNLDVDASGGVPDTGLSHLGSADHAVAHMNGAELRELRRLLQQEMTP